MNSVRQENHDGTCTFAQSVWQLTLLVKTLWVVMSFNGEDSFSLAALDPKARCFPDIWKIGKSHL